MIYLHKEAFCLMKYASADGQVVEWLWNSRDGVTPFVITAQDGVTELAHVEWNLDRPLPQYQPLPGERIFTDFTREAAERSTRELVERYWDHPETPISRRYPTREAAYEAMLANNLYHVELRSPMVISARDWQDPRDHTPRRRTRHG